MWILPTFIAETALCGVVFKPNNNLLDKLYKCFMVFHVNQQTVDIDDDIGDGSEQWADEMLEAGGATK